MPYISRKRRVAYQPYLVYILNEIIIDTPGDLNYLITILVHKYLESHKESYQFINDAIGALESAKLELYRRTVSKFEDKKIKENGDL